jgi:hypothetical protein
MTTPSHRLRVARVPGRFAVCRLSPDAEIPPWAQGGSFVSITRTAEELSIICEEARLPPDAMAERDFAAVRVAGTLEPTLVGVLVSLAIPLAAADIPILAIGTYDTDYVLVRCADLPRATDALRGAGHEVADD